MGISGANEPARRKRPGGTRSRTALARSLSRSSASQAPGEFRRLASLIAAHRARGAIPPRALLGLFVNAAHVGRGLSLGQLAKRYGVSESTVHRWVYGHANPYKARPVAAVVAHATHVHGGTTMALDTEAWGPWPRTLPKGAPALPQAAEGIRRAARADLIRCAMTRTLQPEPIIRHTLSAFGLAGTRVWHEAPTEPEGEYVTSAERARQHEHKQGKRARAVAIRLLYEFTELTQAEVARWTHCTEGTVRYWIFGKKGGRA